MTTQKRRGDPLALLYIFFILLLTAGTLVVVVALFVPREAADAGAVGEGLWVPGSLRAPSAPARVLSEPPGVHDRGNGRYLVVIEASNWEYTPSEIRIPVGSEVTFRGHSEQDYHGMALIGTPVMLSFPQNELSEATHTFTERGEYLFVCSEYCGGGHATMRGVVIVE